MKYLECVIDVNECSYKVKGSPQGDRGAHIGVEHGMSNAMLGMVRLRDPCEDPFVAFNIAVFVVQSMQVGEVPVANEGFHAKREEIVETL